MLFVVIFFFCQTCFLHYLMAGSTGNVVNESLYITTTLKLAFRQLHLKRSKAHKSLVILYLFCSAAPPSPSRQMQMLIMSALHMAPLHILPLFFAQTPPSHWPSFTFSVVSLLHELEIS